MRARTRLFGGLLIAAAFVVGCKDSDLAGLNGGTGTVTVQLTDAPFPFSEVSGVNVFIVRVDAKAAEPSDSEAADSAHSGWTTIATPNALINLLSLAGGKTTTLGAGSLTTGTYRGFRIVIDPSKSNVTLKSGTPVDVKWPSAAQSGIKVLLDKPIEVIPGGLIVLADFDIGRSFHMRGNSISQNGLIFNPVVHAIVADVSGSVSGSVRGDSATGAGIAGATVEVLKAGTLVTDTDPTNVIRSGVTDASGNFHLAFLVPGTYALRATPPAASLYKPALLPGGLTITTNTETTGKIIVVTK